MLIDTRAVADGSRIEKEVCIIGGGAAGIAMAMELDKRGIGVALVESGGLKLDASTLDLYRGQNSGIPYDFAHGFRSRYLGGSSNCWGGFCRPWDDFDFEKRDWLPTSGWPITGQELRPFYQRAQRMLKLDSDRWDPAYWVKAAARDDVRRLDLDPSKVDDIVTMLSPPVRFGLDYRRELETSRNLEIYLWANVVDIETDNPAVNVRRIKASTLTGRTIWISAKTFVLATGGIENARLLLAANSVQPAGLGNGHDVVGRYFMDHPRLVSAKVDFAPQYRYNALYDAKFHIISSRLKVQRTMLAGQLRLTPEVQRREQLLSSQVWFRSLFPAETTDSVRALSRFKQRFSGKYLWSDRFGSDLLEVMKRPVDSTLFTVGHLFLIRSLIRDVRMEAIVEPEPIADSRITLSHERDPLGMPRVNVDWRLTDRVKHTFDRSFRIIGEELVRRGIAKVEFDEPLGTGAWPSSLEGTYHHMGTTRMHDSPKLGVVDRDCRVHGMSNLYLAGSSVFTTGAANFPTITLVALALRLADRLAGELQKTPELAKTAQAA